ncbi:PLP-dependent transferase [Paraphaeosphaeria sporulosa]|uniref:PLP-dependent transferase n=1 Tax=Paraphaeosphaeria sporulosa TaxID=1460663 RepID=A0A177C2W7_9PLEO|nr:PLP-dependent transferase [Paraphaeosphaeria sporulosa]OAG01212.1 PLP-dependent transferase [Paraphaeosphaeria sporulosa]
MGLHNDVLGLARFMPNWKKQFLRDVKKPRKHAWFVTNLGGYGREAGKGHTKACRHCNGLTLDLRRDSRSLYTIVQICWQTSNATDFCSGHILSLNATGKLRNEFVAEAGKGSLLHPWLRWRSTMDRNYSYLEEAEREIAAFHGAEEGLLVGSVFEANVAVETALPQPGDVLLYDKLVHASTHEGMKKSRAKHRVEFLHNDLESFRDTIIDILENDGSIREGKSTVLVAVESIYSMGGDVCPLREIVDIGEKLCSRQGNIQFIVDDAYSVGVIGPKGSGLVRELGLEKHVAVVVHSYRKPSRTRIQAHARLFFETLTSHPLWNKTKSTSLIRVPLAEGWEKRPFLTHIMTVSTRQRYTYWLFVHLMAASYSVFPVPCPIVPIGQNRLRIIFHSNNTE